MKNIFPKKSKNNVIIKNIQTNLGVPVYECINKASGNCKSKGNKKGTGLVLEKNEACFDCEFDGARWLNTSSGSSQSFSKKVPDLPQIITSTYATQFDEAIDIKREPIIKEIRDDEEKELTAKLVATGGFFNPHRRSRSFCDSPTTSTTFLTNISEESVVDPYMHTDVSVLRRQGALLRTTKIKERANENSLVSAPKDTTGTASYVVEEINNHSFATQLNRSSSGTSTLGAKSASDIGEIIISYINEGKVKSTVNSPLSQDLISSPRTPITGLWPRVGDRPRTPGGYDKLKGELIEILKDVTQHIIDIKEEDELERAKKQLEIMLAEKQESAVENQKLKDENELLKQQLIEMKKYKLQAEESRVQRLIDRRGFDEDRVENLCKAYEIYEVMSRKGKDNLNEVKKNIEIAKKELRSSGANLEDVQEICKVCEEIGELRAENGQEQQFVATIVLPPRSFTK